MPFFPGASRHRGDSHQPVQLRGQSDAAVEAGPRLQQSHSVGHQESSRWGPSAVFLTRSSFFICSYAARSLGHALASAERVKKKKQLQVTHFTPILSYASSLSFGFSKEEKIEMFQIHCKQTHFKINT